MKMISAQEMREATTSKLNTLVEDQINEINKILESKKNTTDNCLYYFKYIQEGTKNELRKQGFNVSGGDSEMGGGYTYKIFW